MPKKNLFNGDLPDLGHERPSGSRPRNVSHGPDRCGWDAFGWQAFTGDGPQKRPKMMVTSFHRTRRIR
jgi:hypothetical protein